MQVRPSHETLAVRRGSQRRPTEVRREEIISVAVRLWAERGYHATSVADLCEVTGIGKGAFYHHVGSKEDVLFEIHNRFVDPMLDFGHQVLAANPPPRDALRELGRRLLEIIAEYRDYVTVFFRELPALSPQRLEGVRLKRQEFERIVETIIERGIALGEFRDVPVRVTTLAFLGMHNYSYTWLRPRGSLTPAEIAEVFNKIFVGGIGRHEVAAGSRAPSEE